jgi:hypothetical protein
MPGEHTIATLAETLRGIPRSAPILIRTADGLRRVTMIHLIHIAANGQQTGSGAGEVAIVLEA